MIIANKDFYFKNGNNNLELLKQTDLIFTHVNPNHTKGKTIVTGIIQRPALNEQNEIVSLNEIGQIKVNNGIAIDINYCSQAFALNCDSALIETLKAISENNTVIFTSNLVTTL